MKFMKSILLSFILTLGAVTYSQTPEKIKQTEEEIRQEMITISRQLGVTCSECHNVKNFTDDSKKTFKASLKHMKMVELLKLNGFSGSNAEPEASCFMCHKGKLRFKHKEPITDHNRHDQIKKREAKEKVELAPDLKEE